MQMPFERIKISGDKRKSSYVAEQILDAISKGKYKVGDKLPPERTLAEEMGISRPSVREALGALKVAGVIERVTGDGTYVQRLVENSQAISQALAIVEESTNLVQAFEARKGLEATAAELAIDRANAKDLKKLQETLTTMQNTLGSKDYNEYSRTNRDFHVSIAIAAKNPFIERIVTFLLDTMNAQLSQKVKRDYYSYLDSDSKHIEEYFELHHRIFVAIEKRDRQILGERLGNHFENSIYMRIMSSAD